MTTTDDAPCGRCGKPVHLQHDAPCPHGEVACAECGHEAVCEECLRVFELEALDAMVGTEPPC